MNKEYHKIETIFERDMDGNKKLIEGEFRNPLVEYLKDNEWVFTEKIDGTNIRVFWDGHKVSFNGRTNNAQLHGHLVEKLNELFMGNVNEELFEQKFGESEVYLFGEGYGAGIQNGCLSEDTEILTANGWKMLYSVFEGDYVFACDYKNDMKLQLEPVKQKFIYDYDEDAYHIKDTGYYNSELMETDHIVSKNHNVLVSESWATNNSSYPDKVFAEKLYQIVKDRKTKQINSDFHIPGLNGFIPCTIEKIPYKGKVWCVEVESGAFVARRNGKIFITGNKGGGDYIDEKDFILFDVMVGNIFLERENVEEIAKSFNLKCVPIVPVKTITEAVEYVKSKPLSQVGKCVKEIEGVVGTPKQRIFDFRGNRVIVKIKVEDFI